MLVSNFQGNLLLRGICLQHQSTIEKFCSKMITRIIQYNTAIYYIMPITRDRFRPYCVSSGGCKKHLIINMMKKQNFPLGAKKKCNTKQYDTAIHISWGSHSRTHTHMTWLQVTSVSPNRGAGLLSRLIINTGVAGC